MSQVKLDLKDVNQSRLWTRLDHSLKTIVENTATQAEALLETVRDHMPLYTFHNRRHILNIVGWMDWLVEEALAEISPLEALRPLKFRLVA